MYFEVQSLDIVAVVKSHSEKEKMPSETDVASKAISGLGMDWIENLWAGLC